MKAFWISAARTGMALTALFGLHSGFAEPTTAAAEPATAATDPTTAAAEPSLGVWQKHEYRFAFMGFTSTYSCDGLADKIKVLLIAAGARRDAKAQPGACASNFGQPDKFANATLTFYTLAPAAADVPADTQPVKAVWRRVSLSALPTTQLNRGDCELVEQFGHNVLPMFTTRNIESHVTCVPHQLSGSSIDLRFEALALAPAQPPAPKPAKSAGT
jgi:hypothetical protein